MSSEWDWDEMLLAVLGAVAAADASGNRLTSEQLADVFPWQDETHRMGTIDNLCSSGYLVGPEYPSDKPHFNEWRDLRLGPLGVLALERLRQES